MTVLFLDFETFFDEKAGISLKKMALRSYLRVAPVIGVSFAVDRDKPEWVPADSESFLALMADVDEFGQEPDNIVAAYNVPFDARVLRFGRLEAEGDPLGVRWPLRIRDAMEMAMAAWPNMPGGYSLRNVAQWLHLPPKLVMDDVIKGRETWEDYCNRDTLLLQEIYYRALKRLPEDELLVSEMANALRGHSYQINGQTVNDSLKAFTKNTELGVEAAVKFLSNYARDGEDLGATIFGGYDEGKVRSVKAKALKELLIGALGFDTTSTSLKKINPSHLAERPDVATLLQATSKANKGLYYQKRALALTGVTEVDMELGYFRATNTGRYSAPTTGRGINKQNLSKKDKTIAKPLRQMMSLPDDMCYVRADASNIEYRVEGLLTGCSYIHDLFAGNIAADPYGHFAYKAFGVKCQKGQPLRDVVAKAAVLGYGFCLAEGSPVLTKDGWKPIETITSEDELWDGVEWVRSRGAVPMGTKPTVDLHGVRMTLEHEVLCQTGWHRAGEIVSSGGILRPLLAPSSDTGLWSAKNATSVPNVEWKCNVSAEHEPRSGLTNFGGGSVSSAHLALEFGTANEVEGPLKTPTSSPTRGSVVDGGHSGIISASVAPTPMTKPGSTTEAKESKPGSTLNEPSSRTLSRSPAGTSGASNSTGSMGTETTPPETSDSLLQQKTGLISLPVWDIVDAGPRARFQVGPLIAHNCMGRVRAAEEMNKAVADPINKVSPQQIEQLCRERGWTQPTTRYVKGIVTRLKCPWPIVVAADNSREAFHDLHPEFFSTADWLMRSVTMLTASRDPERLIDTLYSFPGAPDRNMIDLSIDKELEFPTVRARMLNHSMPTVTWRHLSCSHPGLDGLGAVTANKGPRHVHRSLLIENVTQSAARIMLINAKLELRRRGWKLIDSVHDEILILCPRERNAVLKARADLLEVMSPAGPLGYGWAFYAKPNEVTVTRTLYEDEGEAMKAWEKLEKNDPTWTEHLV